MSTSRNLLGMALMGLFLVVSLDQTGVEGLPQGFGSHPKPNFFQHDPFLNPVGQSQEVTTTYGSSGTNNSNEQVGGTTSSTTEGPGSQETGVGSSIGGQDTLNSQEQTGASPALHSTLTHRLPGFGPTH
ncbi:hypothetical protein Hamer_G009334 [Homarus americanus]|uniref:Uncharacterized protein n=1 Tax=Homarus americanus TaxID=6706 RepID=A0A8J5MJM8_HOMAM|nr:hypothetical protein Hamer_G009334 [Homarus americanus]